MRLAYVIHTTSEFERQYHLSCCKILWTFRQYGQAGQLRSMPEQLTQPCTAFCATCHVSYLTPMSELCMHNPPQPCDHACTRSCKTLVAHIKAAAAWQSVTSRIHLMASFCSCNTFLATLQQTATAESVTLLSVIVDVKFNQLWPTLPYSLHSDQAHATAAEHNLDILTSDNPNSLPAHLQQASNTSVVFGFVCTIS